MDYAPLDTLQAARQNDASDWAAPQPHARDSPTTIVGLHFQVTMTASPIRAMMRSHSYR